MRSSDIVGHLAATLPTFVDDFTTSVSIVSLTCTGTTVTAETAAAHGLVAGKAVNIVGAKTPLTCSITRVGIVGTLVTVAAHDITEYTGAEVEIAGATEAEFNDTFTILSIPDRYTINFQMPDAGSIVATGSPALLNGAGPLRSYNGLKQVATVPDTTHFTYTVSAALPSPAQGAISAKTAPRISAAVDYTSLLNAYTKQGAGKAWIFVVLGDSIASKNRAIDADSTDNIQSGHYFNQRLIQSVTFYVFLPSSGEIAGRAPRDRCEELLNPICRSVLGVRFPSLLENSNNPLMLVSHGVQDYNGSFYVHQYAFEATIQLGPTDIYVPSDDVAFRDIDMGMLFDVGTGVNGMTATINLDGSDVVIGPLTVTLTYLAGPNGTITGNTAQIVNIGGSGTEVIAVPNTGYSFTSWDDGILTAARTDLNITANLTVTASFSALSWALVGSGLPIAGVSQSAIGALNATDVAYIDSGTDQLRLYRFNGTNWSLQGSGLAITVTDYSAITGMNSTDIAFVSNNAGLLTTYRFNAGAWAVVGTSLSVGTGVPALAKLNTTDVAYFNSTTNQLKTYRFSGASWSQIGNALVIAVGVPSMTALTAADVVMYDSAAHDLRVYHFDGANWSAVGNPFVIGTIGAIGSITALNSTDVAFISGTGGILQTYHFNGLDWSAVGAGLPVPNSNPALAALTGADIALIDGTNDQLRTYRFS